MFPERLPETVIIGGMEYEIKSDFRTSIKFEQMLFDPQISKAEALSKGIDLYYPIRPTEEKEALEKIIWFYRCGETELRKPNRNSGKRLYSTEHDFKYIYAAFLEQYRIDLLEEDMHWWKYQALFVSLNECMFQRIVGYRAIDIKKLPAEERKKYRQLQKAFELPEKELFSASDRAFQEGLEDALLNGDITDFLKRNNK